MMRDCDARDVFVPRERFLACMREERCLPDMAIKRDVGLKK